MDVAVSSRWSDWLRERWFVLGLVLFFAALSFQYSDKISDSRHTNRSAFLRWRDQILELQDGVNIWEKYNYPNPPIMVLILEPLAVLPPLVGSLTWFYLKVAMAVAAILLSFRLIETPGKPWPLWAKALAVAMSLRPIMGDLSHGNVNLWILFLCVLTFEFFRRRRDVTAGISLALAIACKVTPALLVPYFVWKRSWKLLAGSACGLVLFFWLIPGVFLGFEQNHHYLSSWYQGMIKPFVFDGVVTTDHENQSLPGLVYRMVTDSPSFSTFVNGVYTPLESHNVVTLDPSVARIIVRVCMAAFAGLVILVCRSRTDDRQRWQLAAEYGLILVGMLLFSERTWKHHCVTLIIPFCVLSYYLAVCQPGGRTRWFVISMLATATLLIAMTASGWSHWLERFSKLAQVYGAYVWANLALVAALATVLLQQVPSGDPQDKFFGQSTSAK